MGKSQAQRAREYRERKKLKLKDKWRASEAERQKKYYVRSSDMTKKELEKRQTKTREKVKRFRQKHTEHSSVARLSDGKLTGTQVRGRRE